MWRSTSKRPGRPERTPALLAALLLLALPAARPLEAEPSPDLVPIDLIVDGVHEGEIPTDLSGGGIALDAERLSSILEDRVDPAALEKLRAAAMGRPVVPASALEALGIAWSYDPRRLEVTLTVPAPLRRQRVLSLESARAGLFGRTESPAAVSGYLNLRARADAVLRFPAAAAATVDLPVEATLEPVLNLYGWVLEGSGTAEYAGAWDLRLDRARLVHDFLPFPARLTVGTFQAPGADFLSTRSLAGLQFTVDPLLTGAARRSADEEEFQLAQPSEVSIFLNGDLLRRTRLDAGRYVLTGLPYLKGLNRLTVQPKGSEEPQSRFVPWDSRLLRTGDLSLSASLGITPWVPAPPVLTAQLLYGLHPRLRAGAQVEAGMDRQRGGLELLTATEAGSVRAAAAASFDGSFTDLAFLAEYQLSFPFSPALPSLGLSARYTGARFLGPGGDVSENPNAWVFTASLGQALPLSVGLSLAGSYTLGRAAGTDSGTATLTLTRPMAPGTTLSVLLHGRFAPGARPDLSASILLTSSMPDGLMSTGVRSDVLSGTSAVDVQVKPGRGWPSFSATADGLPPAAAVRSGAGLGVRYAGGALDASLSGSLSGGGGTAPYGSSSLEAGTALLFADGVFAVSAPVDDSFALLVPEGSLRGETVVANPSADGPLAAAQGGATGVIPRLRSYSRTPLFLDAPEVPPGTDLGDVQRVVAPTYRSGTLVRVGTVDAVPAEGTLLLPDGKPARLRAGEAVLTGAAEAAPVRFFTDETGFFQLYGLVSGRYSLRVYSVEGARAAFTVPDGASGPLALGSLRLAAGKED